MVGQAGDFGPRDVATFLAVAAGLSASQPLRLGSPLLRTTATGLAPTGTTQATALPLTLDINVITTTANGTAVILTSFGIGAETLVVNQGVNTVPVYPPTTSSTINALSVGSPYTMATLTFVRFVQVSATQFYSC
jgi:hypothetical protein